MGIKAADEKLTTEPVANDNMSAYVVSEEIYAPEPNNSEISEVPMMFFREDIPLDYDVQIAAMEAANTFGTPLNILYAVAFRESSFRVDATNGFCWGLMQINECNFDWLQDELSYYGVMDIKNNPRDNLMAASYLLNKYYVKYADWNLALMCYNCGERGAQKQWAKGWYSSAYSRSIIEYSESL